MNFYRPLTGLLILFVLLGQAGCQSSNGLNSKHYVSARNSKIKIQDPIRAKIKNYLLSRKINGSIAVVNNNKVIFNEGVGYANFQKKLLNTPATTHPIGSITKSLVATSIMQLQEKGKLNIQDPVAKYLPDFPNGKNIKLIHLLTHTSGIHARVPSGKAKTPKELVQGIEKKTIKFAAGTKWNYRDENYVVLGYILQQVTGTSLHKYIAKNIFEKAGMKHSGFISRKNPNLVKSVGYIRTKSDTLSITKITNPNLFGYGDVYSTARDLCLYDKALMNGKLVSKKSLKEILTPGSSSRYGLGLYNYGYAAYSRGVIGGWEAIHVYYKDNTSIAILLNVRDKSVDIHQLSRDIFRILEENTPNPRLNKVGIGDVIPKVCLS